MKAIRELFFVIVLVSCSSVQAVCVSNFGDSLTVTSPFGWRYLKDIYGQWKFHYGVDFSKKVLSEKVVLAGVAGKYTMYPGTPGCGNMVIITPDDASAFRGLKYCHLKNLVPRTNGSKVTATDKLGEPSNVGLPSAAEHIHVEVITQGDVASSASARRVPMAAPIFCGSMSGTPVGVLTRPAADNDAFGGAADKFDKDFYQKYYTGSGADPAVFGGGTVAQANDALSGVKRTVPAGSGLGAQAAANASGSPQAPVAFEDIEGSFTQVIAQLSERRFANQDWQESLAGKGAPALLYEIAQMMVHDVYLEHKKSEMFFDNTVLLAQRAKLLARISFAKGSGPNYRQLRDEALRDKK